MKLKADSIRTVMIDLENRLPWDESQTNIWSPNGLATFDSYKALGHNFPFTQSQNLLKVIM